MPAYQKQSVSGLTVLGVHWPEPVPSPNSTMNAWVSATAPPSGAPLTASVMDAAGHAHGPQVKHP
ncbi:MAG: hypothetical protein IPJ65_18195 [Archangiaceae bacterium]|nr:hypothetical protein [Archangiaceae bacterium]